jgi:hypothetical protein
MKAQAGTFLKKLQNESSNQFNSTTASVPINIKKGHTRNGSQGIDPEQGYH